ncbi:hypothetical protein PENTCL1PPCAC_27050, partial [Pristionchus entomophagus]
NNKPWGAVPRRIRPRARRRSREPRARIRARMRVARARSAGRSRLSRTPLDLLFSTVTLQGAKDKKGANSKGKTPAAKGKSPGGKGAPGGGGLSAKSLPPLQRAPADKRPTKTPLTPSSTKSGKSSAALSASSKKGQSSGESSTKTPAEAIQAKKRENHAKSLKKTGLKGKSNDASDVNTDITPPSSRDVKKGSKEPKDASKKKIVGPPPPVPPPPRDTKKKQEVQSRGSSTAEPRLSSARAARPRRVSRSKLPMQKLAISSHIEDGIVVSQWYYTELRELGTQPSSVADLLQGGPRQQLNLPQQQQS